jgi:hypothetical protein
MSFAIVAGVAIGGSVISGIVGAGAAKKQAAAAARAAARQQREIDALKSQRQEIQNPYAGMTNLSELAVDTSRNLSNTYASLGVATQAAEIQMEQTDIALANTLDTIAATGASAGGATALAQAALRSKKDVAANIQQQEAQNEKLKAQGEQQLQQMKMAEQQRLQSIAISEGQRIQQAEAQGIMYEFQQAENRLNMDLNRAAGLQDRALQQQADANANQAAAYGGMMSALGSIGGSAIGAAGSVEAAEITADAQANTGSDRRLKKNIKLLGYSPSGLNIYSFEYINKKFGEGTYQGVMSDEIPLSAVVKHEDGFDRVDYSKLDVEFKQI